MAEREAVAVDITVDVPVATWMVLCFAILTSIAILVFATGIAANPVCAPEPVDGNVAKCMTYELLPTPNYTHPNGNDDTSDSYDLTDGIYVAASHASDLSVTWKYSAAVRVSIDLERPACADDPLACHPIKEIFFQIQDQKGAAGVWCPEEVSFEVSDDGVSYYPVSRWALPAGYPESADCGAEGPDFNGRNYRISSGLLETRGAHVRVVIETQPLGGRFVFIDELEARAGTHSPTLTNYLENPQVDYEAELDALGAGWKLFAVDPLDLIHSHSLPAPGATEASSVPSRWSWRVSICRPSANFPLRSSTGVTRFQTLPPAGQRRPCMPSERQCGTGRG